MAHFRWLARQSGLAALGSCNILSALTDGARWVKFEARNVLASIRPVGGACFRLESRARKSGIQDQPAKLGAFGPISRLMASCGCGRLICARTPKRADRAQLISHTCRYPICCYLLQFASVFYHFGLRSQATIAPAGRRAELGAHGSCAKRFPARRAFARPRLAGWLAG